LGGQYPSTANYVNLSAGAQAGPSWFLFSNSTWKGGRLIPNYRKPFDVLALTNAAHQNGKATLRSRSGLSENWLPFVDAFRTLLLRPTPEVELLFSDLRKSRWIPLNVL